MKKATFVSPETLEQLDWPWVLKQIRNHLKTAPARESCHEQIWLPDREAAREVMREAEEAQALLAQGVPFPLGEVPDIRRHQMLAEKEAILLPADLLDMAAWMDAVDAARRFLVAHRQQIPLLHRHAARAPSLSHLVYDIRSAVDETGELRDEASPALASLRKKARKLHKEIHERLESYLSAREYQDLLQDRFYTLKEDRYVLPIKTQHRSFVEGIVLGSSNSGATLFIEPREIVDLNNSHKLVLLEAQKEANRILMEIVSHIRQDRADLEKGHAFLTHLDLIFARALFSRATAAATPSLKEEEGVRLLRARHPILQLRKERVVPNDIVIAPPTRTLLVTGPNAGGKTAVLKTVGLCALMVRAGLPLPAAPGSNMPFFDFVFSDIGDSQSLEEDRSTFSGHLLRFRNFLDHPPRFGLALLDEIFIGTNPDEGSALAQAVLEHLSGTGGVNVATTHFLSLKSMAFRDPRVQNVSLGFDPETFRPTYELSAGIPGASNALQIAAQLGLPADILDRARQILGRTGAEVQDLLLEIQAEKNRAQAERLRCEAARTEVEGLEREWKRRTADLELREKEVRRTYRDRLEAAFQEALVDIRKWKTRRAQPAASPSTSPSAQALRELLETRRQALSEEGPFHVPPPRPRGEKIEDWATVHRGDPVYLADLQTEASVLEPPDRKGVLTVEAKGFRMQVARENVYRLPVRQRLIRDRTPQAPAGARRFGSPTEDLSPGDAAGLERCDLRGMTVDETLDAVSQGLDRAFRQRVPRLVLIHGLGKGVLRDAVREYLGRAPYACTFRPGRRGEGGDGVTVVEFDAGSFPP